MDDPAESGQLIGDEPAVLVASAQRFDRLRYSQLPFCTAHQIGNSAPLPGSPHDLRADPPRHPEAVILGQWPALGKGSSRVVQYRLEHGRSLAFDLAEQLFDAGAIEVGDGSDLRDVGFERLIQPVNMPRRMNCSRPPRFRGLANRRKYIRGTV
jgi:hypothetical protein